jgi:hypothetical protein
MSEFDQYWERRTLCGDGSCIGVIGPDGRCKECGQKANKLGNLHASICEPVEDAEIKQNGPNENSKENRAQRLPVVEEKVSTDDAWERRTLCTDGNCIGIIGADGYCKECGKEFVAT